VDERIKRNVTELWQDTANIWKDGVAAQYHSNCVTVLEGLLDRFSALNGDLDCKTDEILKSIERYETI
jgi:hypothetical protein